ncbi:MAG: hypothetical protein K2X35_24030 [Bryobacteraceae bacterium]|nr:hypothetical protein [Bryobacteraceae bacterium]
MFKSSFPPTEREYTAIAALLSTALLVIPALLVISQPVSYLAISAAVAGSAACIAAAAVLWKRSNKPAIAVVAGRGAAK